MGRGRIPGATAGADRGRSGKAGRLKKAAPGLRVVERSGFFHVYGTVRAGGRSRIIRKSTGLRAVPENRDAAEALRLESERGFRDQVVHGKTPGVPVAIAAEQFLNRSRGSRGPLGEIDRAKIRDVVRAFPYRFVSEIDYAEWTTFVERRLAGR
jgi:hypothetical protein